MKHEHKHHQHHTASTERERHSEHQDAHAPQAAEAGVETDTRWGDAEEAFDIAGSVVRVEAARGGSRITISRGRADGIHEGMEGYLRNGSGTHGDSMLTDFSIDSVGKRSCTAFVDLRPEDLEHVTAVVNPAQAIARTAATGERNAKIVRVTISGGRARIVISGGRDEGYAFGTAGYVAGPDGHPIARFELEQVDARTSVATVDLTPDTLQHNPRVVLNSGR